MLGPLLAMPSGQGLNMTLLAILKVNRANWLLVLEKNWSCGKMFLLLTRYHYWSDNIKSVGAVKNMCVKSQLCEACLYVWTCLYVKMFVSILLPVSPSFKSCFSFSFNFFVCHLLFHKMSATCLFILGIIVYFISIFMFHAIRSSYLYLSTFIDMYNYPGVGRIWNWNWTSSLTWEYTLQIPILIYSCYFWSMIYAWICVDVANTRQYSEYTWGYSRGPTREIHHWEWVASGLSPRVQSA